MTDKFSKIVEENRNLRISVDNLEMQSRSNALVIQGLPETSYADLQSKMLEGLYSSHRDRTQFEARKVMFYYKKLVSVPDFDFVREDKDKKKLISPQGRPKIMNTCIISIRTCLQRPDSCLGRKRGISLYFFF